MNDIIWLTMRRMRTPLIVMILTYSLTVFGMVAIPAHDASGQPVQVGYLDAAYFVAIMATTIGFGEIPYTFSHVQRLYVYIALFPNVVAWLYSIGTIISLLVDAQFRAVLPGVVARQRAIEQGALSSIGDASVSEGRTDFQWTDDEGRKRHGAISWKGDRVTWIDGWPTAIPL